MATQPLRVVVIGGGAAGFFGAIAAAEHYPHPPVTILEAAQQPLTKVRVSGGGRCNVTHACFDPALLVQHYPRGGQALRGAFSRFQVKDTVDWFQQHGVELKTEADGRMFPVTDISRTVVDCLMQTAIAAGVELRTGAIVQSVTADAGTFHLTLRSGEIVDCDRLLLATGSHPLGYAIARSLGHSLESPVPSLFTFTLPDPRLQDLAGVSVSHVHLRLTVENHPPLEQTGALLITHWGLSGPAVLKLSAWGARLLHDNHYQADLRINWLPQTNGEKLRQQLLAVKSQLSRKQIASNCPVILPRRLWERLVARVGIGETTRWAELSHKTLNQLILELTQGQYRITGKGAFKDEFVTCGGIPLKQVDFKTMQSRCCPGLYLAGELLDIDGFSALTVDAEGLNV